MIAGVDFGARFAGTTVVCFDLGDHLELLRVARGEDADARLFAFVAARGPRALYLDAPLSLPAAYGHSGSDFFYRACDRLLAAMSPMFLGALTARAIQLKHTLAPTPVFEVYPRAAARLLEQQHVQGYRKDRPSSYLAQLQRCLPLPVPGAVTSWHDIDAILAWWSGWRHTRGEACAFGHPSEGIIWV
ncbi:MAG: hypothetical protein KatS3mg077_2235 [Candidatus Binatia bacterium]|nr:MAG: hypothetical protein KatS3mg077_2235 [Candidatus Binatia bacterium]